MDEILKMITKESKVTYSEEIVLHGKRTEDNGNNDCKYKSDVL